MCTMIMADDVSKEILGASRNTATLVGFLVGAQGSAKKERKREGQKDKKEEEQRKEGKQREHAREPRGSKTMASGQQTGVIRTVV